MFKVGQVWRSQKGHICLVREVSVIGARVNFVGGPLKGREGFMGRHGKASLIGNNYKPKALPEQCGFRKEDC